MLQEQIGLRPCALFLSSAFDLFISASFRSRVARLSRAAIVAMLLHGLAGCAVSWVATYDKESIDRTTEISKSALKIYQDLLLLPAGQRKSAVLGDLGQRHADLETLIRVHLLKETARTKNGDSVKIAGNLLESWQRFTANHRSNDRTALSDASLSVERDLLERHLRAAFAAEEAKK